MFEGLSDAELIEVLGNAAAKNKLMMWSPYGLKARTGECPEEPTWQLEWHDAGKFATQRMVMAANGVGKSETCGSEFAMHVTGQYPPWWSGYRFDRGGWEAWIGSIDNDMQKRGPQRALLGRNLEEDMGRGFLPAASIVKIDTRQAGVKEVVDTIIVDHVSGENVTVKFLTFEQGWRKWQSGDPKIIWWDEEPNELVVDQKDILDETLTRLVRNDGIFIVGYTPLLGQTQLTEHFMYSTDPSVFYIGATWDDAPHMTTETKERIKRQYKSHAVDARSKGIPMLGEGRIFDTAESDFLINPIPIPDHWARIKGIDFGLAHPAARASLAHDRDTDIVYLYDCWKKTNVKTRDHCASINAVDDWIPVAWPHDGEKRDPKSGIQFHRIYRDNHHVNMLSQSARYKSDTGGAQAQWPIIETMRDRLDDGRFKVFRTCTDFLQEYRSYHQKNEQIVSKRDDVLKSVFYAVMMLRFAVSQSQADRVGRKRVQPAAFRTMVN